MSLPFLKMNGLGNDFVIVPGESGRFDPTAEAARVIADRAGGVGCDQLIALTPSSRADVAMRIWNADGGEVEACGNAARCVAWLIMEAAGRDTAAIETPVDILHARRAGPNAVTIDMGAPGLDWRDIPLARAMDTLALDLDAAEALGSPVAVSMGNPHAVFFVADAEAAPVAEVGPEIEHHSLFPNRANVGFAQVLGRGRIRLRVWERGAGETRACGTGACAALVAACRRGLCDRAAVVALNGGDLFIDWREDDGHVLMTGPVAVEFAGRLPDLTAGEPSARTRRGAARRGGMALGDG
jgi:diaminopimelate epimerase